MSTFLNISSEYVTIPNAITASFILWIFFAGLTNLVKPLSNFKAVNIPNYLISLGILGTFAGIFWGLMHFDVNDIQSSVPSLIGGMKFAFGSSVTGMIFALLIKRKYIKQQIKQEFREQGAEKEALDIEGVLSAILEIRSSLIGKEDSLLNQFRDLRNELNENVKKISKAISGDDDSSLVTQVKLLRGESRDELTKLNKSVDKFYEEIAGKGTDVLLEALKVIITDFNKNLNEQFGENFKQLNEAVGKILEWQNQYKEQLTSMIETQKQTSADMKVATDAFNDLLEKAKSLTNVGNEFKVIMNDLSVLLQSLEQQRNNISDHVQLFSEISEKAANGLPKVEEKISQLSEKLIESIEKHSSKINQHLETTISKSDEMGEQMLKGMKKNNDELNQHIQQAVERTNEQVVKLDQAMSEELTKALESFGKQLTALSQKFVEDYIPLTEKLKEVVEMAKKI